MNGLLLAGYLACFAADAGTTAHALTMPGAHEAILTQSGTANAAILAGEAVALYAVTEKIQRPWLKWTLRFAGGSVHAWAAVHNAQVKGAGR